MLQLEIFKNMKKLKYKQNKLKLDSDFLNNCKQLAAYLNFQMFQIKVFYQYVNTFDISYVINIFPRELLRFI